MILLNDLKTEFLDLVQETKISNTDSFKSIEPISEAKRDSLVFANNQKFLEQALASNAQVIVTNFKLKDLCSESDKSFIFSSIPDLLVTKILQKHFFKK